MTREELVWSGNTSQIVNMGSFVLFGLLALTVVLIPVSIVAITWKYLVIKNQRYELTTQRLKTHTGVLSKKTNELELYRVKDTQFDQPFFLRIFGRGNIILISADSTSSVTKIEAVPNAQALREQIRNLVEARRDQKRVRAVEMEMS